MTADKWRVGEHAKVTIWFGADTFCGSVQTPEIAARIVAAMNEIEPLRARVAELESLGLEMVREQFGDREENGPIPSGQTTWRKLASLVGWEGRPPRLPAAIAITGSPTRSGGWLRVRDGAGRALGPEVRIDANASVSEIAGRVAAAVGVDPVETEHDAAMPEGWDLAQRDNATAWCVEGPWVNSRQEAVDTFFALVTSQATPSFDERSDQAKYYVKARAYGAIAAEYQKALVAIAHGDVQPITRAEEALSWRNSEKGGVPRRAIDEIGLLLRGTSPDPIPACTEFTARDLSGMGRADLESLALRLSARASRAERDHRTMLENLTSTQAHCTRQLEELRVWRRTELAPLVHAMVIAREKHPEGSDLTSLVSEVGEVAKAMYRETPERAREELVDVAVVAMRLFLGEVKKREVTFASGPESAEVTT